MTYTWQTVPFSELLIPKLNPEPVDNNKTYRILGMRWYALGLFIKEDKPGHIIQAHQLFRVDKDDFVYNRLFAWKGSFGIVDDTTAGGYVSGEFPCFHVVTEKAEPKFIHYYLSQESIWNEIERISSGQTNISRLRLRVPDFLRMKIPLPPLAEQRRIVARLEALAAQINCARRITNEIDEEVSELIVSLHLNASSDNQVSMAELLRLDEIREEVKAENDYPQVGIRAFGQGMFFRETVNGTQTTYKYFNRLFNGAVVLSQVKGWEGAIAVCPPDLSNYYASPEYRIFRCISVASSPAYLGVLFSTPWFRSKLPDLSRGVGGRRERLRPERFLELRLPMPKPAKQLSLQSIFSKLDQVKKIHKETLAQCKALLPSILDRAFKGEL